MTEQEREDKLHAWFDMWLRQTDDGILELFVPDAVYVESWGPRVSRCGCHPPLVYGVEYPGAGC